MEVRLLIHAALLCGGAGVVAAAAAAAAVLLLLPALCVRLEAWRRQQPVFEPWPWPYLSTWTSK